MGLSVITSMLLPDDGVALHWQNFSKGCAAAGCAPDGDKWRLCRSIFVAGTDEEARQRVYHPESGYRHFFGHMHKVYTQLGRLGTLKTRPDMRDDEITVDTFIDQRVIFGSPKTVADRLIALRNKVGPFGTLLLTAVDWAGPNAVWERESLSRIAQEVMPAVRRASGTAAAAQH
jgi:alkanesulfonate monooxygenase SsuD/methylene tetrahydromethanopterin reductase-like flavin-dependent oxidoreductase (luciferase family)